MDQQSTDQKTTTPPPLPTPVIISSPKGGFSLPKLPVLSAVLGAFSLLFFGGILFVSYQLSQQNQQVKKNQAAPATCDARWPADPATTCGKTTQAPAQSATNVSLTPSFHWEYGGYRTEDGDKCILPSGCADYSASVYLFEGSSTKAFARADIPRGTTQPTPPKDAAFSDFFNCDYGTIFPNDPNTCHTDRQPNATALKPNTSYRWVVTPFFAGIVHAEQTWSYNFTTGGAVTALTCTSASISPTGTTVSANSETRTLTATSTGGTGTATYKWTQTASDTAGTILNNVWTAPSNLTSLTSAQTWVLTATAIDASNNTATSDACKVTLTYSPTLKCTSVTMDPDNGTITAGGEQRSLKAKISGGSGSVNVTWKITSDDVKGKITTSDTAGLNAKWTAPDSLSAAQSWTITATVEDAAGNTNTNDNCKVSISYSPSKTKVCSGSCSSNSDCPSSLVCSNGSCRNASCTDRVDCVCPPPETKVCNSSCTDSSQCPSGMGCVSGFCRNPSCTSQTNCVCPGAQTYQHFECSTSGACVKMSCNPSTQPCNDTCTSDASCSKPAVAPPIPKSGVELPTILTVIGGGVLLLLGILL